MMRITAFPDTDPVPSVPVLVHQLNNQLCVISTCAAFLVQEMDPKTGAADDVKEIIAAARQAALLARQLLVSSRGPARMPSAHPMSSLS